MVEESWGGSGRCSSLSFHLGEGRNKDDGLSRYRAVMIACVEVFYYSFVRWLAEAEDAS